MLHDFILRDISNRPWRFQDVTHSSSLIVVALTNVSNTRNSIL